MTVIEEIEMYLNAIKKLNPEAHARITEEVVKSLQTDSESQTFQSRGDESEDDFLKRVIEEVKASADGEVNVVVVDENDNVVADSRHAAPVWNFAVTTYVTNGEGTLRRVGISDYVSMGEDELREIVHEFGDEVGDDDYSLLISVVDLNEGTTAHYECEPRNEIINLVEILPSDEYDNCDDDYVEGVFEETLEPLVTLSNHTPHGESTTATFYDLDAYAEYLNSVG